MNEPRNNLIFDDFNSKIILNESLGLNYDLDINHITRRKEFWEKNIPENTLYNYFINNNKGNLYVQPSIFAYNSLNEEFEINIFFSNQFNASLYNKFSNLKNCTLIHNSYKCLIDLGNLNFQIGKSQIFTIEIGNTNMYSFTIKFIYMIYLMIQKNVCP